MRSLELNRAVVEAGLCGRFFCIDQSIAKVLCGRCNALVCSMLAEGADMERGVFLNVFLCLFAEFFVEFNHCFNSFAEDVE